MASFAGFPAEPPELESEQKQWNTTLHVVGDKLVAKENVFKAQQARKAAAPPKPPPVFKPLPGSPAFKRGDYVDMTLDKGSALGLKLVASVDARPHCAKVSWVRPDGAAAAAGVRVDDVLHAVRGKALATDALTKAMFEALVLSLPRLPRPLELTFFRPLPHLDLAAANAKLGPKASPLAREEARRIVEFHQAKVLPKDAKFSPRPPSQAKAPVSPACVTQRSRTSTPTFSTRPVSGSLATMLNPALGRFEDYRD